MDQNPYRGPAHGEHPSDTRVPSSRSASRGFGRTIATFIVTWMIVAVVVSVLIPMDPTGDPQYDAAQESSPLGYMVGISVISFSALVAYIDHRLRNKL